MKTLIKNGRIVTAVADCRIGVLIEDEMIDAPGYRFSIDLGRTTIFCCRNG
jgi:dihydroorotase-like cyclic amidohydrolase